MNWSDDEFEALLGKFRPQAPAAALPTAVKRPAIGRMTLLAAGLVLACAIPVAMRGGWKLGSGVSSANTPAGRFSLLPYVEMTVYASAPPPFVGSEARVSVTLPAAPDRKAIVRVEPEYPPDAQQLGLEAGLDLQVSVNAAGEVTEVARLSGGTNVHRDEPNAAARAEFMATHANVFWRAAEAAARQWKFEPAETGMTCVVSFVFRLRPPASSTALPSAGTGSARPGPAAPSAPVRVGDEIKPPRIVVKVDPVYPEEAKGAGAKGVVLLDVTIGPDGSVIGVHVLRSVPLLDQAAIDAVKQWKYEPTLVNGVPTPVEMNVLLNFRLP